MNEKLISEGVKIVKTENLEKISKKLDFGKNSCSDKTKKHQSPLNEVQLKSGRDII